MKRLSLLLFLGVLFLITGCDDEPVDIQDTAFCSPVYQEDYDRVGLELNDYLVLQNDDDSETSRFIDLVEWLDRKSCVSSAKDLGETSSFPPIQEIEINLLVNGNNIIKYAQILKWDNELSFYRFKE